MASKAGKQFRMWMPHFPLTLVSARNATATHPAFAIFRTDPKMTKHEIKEYLTKIYDLPVKKVNTMNYLGECGRPEWLVYIAQWRPLDGLTPLYHLSHSLSLPGKRKRILTNTAIHYYKYKDFKKAVVYFKPELTNVGKGLRVPELEEGDDDMGMDYSDEEGMPKRPPQQKLPPSSAEA